MKGMFGMTQMIKIKGCSDPMMWYKHKVGEYVTYIRTYDDCYLSRDESGFTNIVRLEDGEVVEVSDLTGKNELTEAQQEILDLLQEECAELIQAISKVRRFGKKDKIHNNIQNMCIEFADLKCLMDIAREKIAEVSLFDINKAIEGKRQKLMMYSRIFQKE
jgi:NTP pyrophosphatase (non-canonical NTP hydrolase)